MKKQIEKRIVATVVLLVFECLEMDASTVSTIAAILTIYDFIERHVGIK